MDFREVPCRTNPLGVKGIGEAGSVGAPPTIVNAILDALRPLGVEHVDMPATSAEVWSRLQSAFVRERIRRRIETRYCDEMVESLDEALSRAAEYQRKGEARSIAAQRINRWNTRPGWHACE